MKFKITIPAQSLKIEIPEQEIEMDFQPIWEIDPPIEPEQPEKPPVVVEPPTVTPVIDWVKLSNEGGEIESGFTYYVPDSVPAIIENKGILITKRGDNETSIIFNKPGDSNWIRREGQNQVLFDVRDNARVVVDGINLYCAEVDDEIDPFKMIVFKGSGLSQNLFLNNLKTNMQRSLLYSVNDVKNEQLCLAVNIDFNGYQWEEMKDNGGRGLTSLVHDSRLHQINPSHYFESAFSFKQDSVTSYVPFKKIENSFHSEQEGNACNILYVEGMTFYLPWGKCLGNEHPLRTIPKPGDEINLIQGIEFMMIKENSLQAGDILEIEGKEYTVISKDRPNQYPYFKNQGYPININIGENFGRDVIAKVIKSRGFDLIGRESIGYMVFKDNKHFQTNIHNELALEYYLASNPIGVLCYNRKGVGIDFQNSVFDGFYRQSQRDYDSRLVCKKINCDGSFDQFTPCD